MATGAVVAGGVVTTGRGVAAGVALGATRTAGATAGWTVATSDADGTLVGAEVATAGVSVGGTLDGAVTAAGVEVTRLGATVNVAAKDRVGEAHTTAGRDRSCATATLVTEKAIVAGITVAKRNAALRPVIVVGPAATGASARVSV